MTRILPLALLLVFASQSARSDTLSNANALFEFAESTYPELLSPATAPTQTLQGFYVRFYSDTGIYLGVHGDNVWAIGGEIGQALVYVGKVGDFIQLSEDDISNDLLRLRFASCSYYVDSVFSEVLDIQRGLPFTGDLDISIDYNTDECVFSSNSIPNHDFNDASANFATPVDTVPAEYRVSLDPVFALSPTPLSLGLDSGIFLNGVKLDLLAAACFGVGDERSGCTNPDQPWRFDPMSPLNDFGTDAHNAHTQPDGSYHYHGNPLALFDQDPVSASPLIGFAADGFPIYGSFIDDGGEIRAVQSSYRLRSGNRPAGPGQPGGAYDGRYVDDYEFVEDSGDLDQCNGMMRDGVYGYYVVDSYPWVLACFQGNPDASFLKPGA